MDTAEKLREALASATGIAWDGCHKIYVLADMQQWRLMREYGYGEDGDTSELIALEPGAEREEAFAAIEDWWQSSCGLRFISNVRTVPGDPNEGFEQIIPQGEEW